jgi:hypothetical protein
MRQAALAKTTRRSQREMASSDAGAGQDDFARSTQGAAPHQEFTDELIGHPASKVAKLFRVALSEQLQRFEEDPALPHQEKLVTLNAVLADLMGVVDRLSRPAPERAPERWASRDAQKSNEGIDAFIARVYASFVPRGMTMAHLRRTDPQAHRAWYDWHRLPENRGKPSPLPTTKQANDRALADLKGKVSPADLRADLPTVVRKRLRLQRMMESRRRRGKQREEHG